MLMGAADGESGVRTAAGCRRGVKALLRWLDEGVSSPPFPMGRAHLHRVSFFLRILFSLPVTVKENMRHSLCSDGTSSQ
jgi:hypothetical protein